MPTRRDIGHVVVVALVLASSAGIGTAVTGVAGGQAAAPESAMATQVDADTVLLRADVDADGTAQWTIEYLVLLDDRNASDAFEELAADIEANESTYLGRFEDRLGATVASAENRTGRTMTLRNASVTTGRQDLGQEYGVIRYTFTWTGFAAVDGSTLEVGDALGGLFLDSDTQLTVGWPAGYDVASVTPAPTERRDRAVVWEGRLDFGSDGPRLELTAGGSGGPAPLALVAAGLVVVALLAGGFVAFRRGVLSADDDTDAGTTADETSGAAPEGGSDEPPEELLSNEERVLKLLDEEGGRIKQQAVAQRLDWTDAKTSQVVSDLREGDKVEVFRLGRENVLTLPGEDDL